MCIFESVRRGKKQHSYMYAMHPCNGTIDLVTVLFRARHHICVSLTRHQLCIFPRLKLVVCFWLYRLFQCVIVDSAAIG